MLELKGKELTLLIPEDQKDKLIQAFYNWCLDNKVKAELTTIQNG